MDKAKETGGVTLRRVLLITYYFPPSGGSGVQRVLKFAKYLPEFGWQPTILTVADKHAAYPDRDDSLYKDVPSSVEVIRTRSWDPYAFYARLQGLKKQEIVGTGFVKESQRKGMIQRLGLWLRANFFLPDARLGWLPFALPAAASTLQRREYSAIMSSGPPHSTHLVGRRLRRRFRVPWVVDMRDPWTDIWHNSDLPQTAWARRIDAALERSVLSTADAVISVSDGVGDELRKKTSIQHYETITNGYDPGDISIDMFPSSPDKKSFVLAHVGTFNARRHVGALLVALQHLQSRMDITLQLVGHVAESVQQAIQEANLTEMVVIVPYVSHDKAIEYMHAADMLLVSVDQVKQNEGIVPAKAYEYLALGKPVLGIAPLHGDLTKILHATEGGRVFDYKDTEGIEDYIGNHAMRIKHGKTVYGGNPDQIKAYSRRSLSRRLADLFDRLAEERP